MTVFDATTPIRVGSAVKGWDLRVPHHRASRWFENPYHEYHRIISMHQNLDPAGVLWEVGAEQGDHAALFGSWLAPHGGKLVLVEPSPAMWPWIRMTFEANAVPPPAASWVGFSDDGGHVTPHEHMAHNGWPTCATGVSTATVPFGYLSEDPPGPRLSIDQMIEEEDAPSPNALSIDVEGAEIAVLKGARRTIERDRPLIWVSVHAEFLRTQYDGHTVSDVLGLMDSYGYRPVYLGADHEQHFLFLPTEASW